MTITNFLLALVALTIYRLYWANLSRERRFILRNKLEAAHRK